MVVRSHGLSGTDITGLHLIPCNRLDIGLSHPVAVVRPESHFDVFFQRQRQSGAILLDEGKPQFDAQDENRSVPYIRLFKVNPVAVRSAPTGPSASSLKHVGK